VAGRRKVIGTPGLRTSPQKATVKEVPLEPEKNQVLLENFDVSKCSDMANISSNHITIKGKIDKRANACDLHPPHFDQPPLN